MYLKFFIDSFVLIIICMHFMFILIRDIIDYSKACKSISFFKSTLTFIVLSIALIITSIILMITMYNMLIG